MKTLNYKILVVVLFIASGVLKAQEQYDKKFHEKYSVNKSSTFDISNKFGNIKIENTTEDSIRIDAEIVVKTSSKEKADKIIDKISVTITKTGDLISAKTELDDISSKNSSFEINYHISMPAYLNINLVNKYGKVDINELEGKSTLSVKYGSLNVNKIMDGSDKPLSAVELGYCDGSRINEFNWGKIIIKYSKLEVEKGKALVISSKYSQLELGQFSSIVAEAAYDDYNINRVINLVINSEYSNIEVENLANIFKSDNKYGDVKISKVPIGFENIDVKSKYAQIDIGIATEASYNLEATCKYADIKYENVTISERTKDDFSIELKGKSGNLESKSMVKIQSDYGDVDLRP